MIRTWRPSFPALLTGVFALFGMLWGGYLGARHIAGLGSGLDRIEYLTLDGRFLLAGARPPPAGVVIAAIDDATLHQLGVYPAPRDKIARILRDLFAYGPRVIALDMLFIDAGNPDADATLAQSLKAGPSVVGAVGLFGRDRSVGEDAGTDDWARVPSPTTIRWPVASVRAAARSGLVNLSTDTDGVPRFIPMIFRTGDAVVPSFPLAVASAALNAEPAFASGSLTLGALTIPLDYGSHLPIRYYGPRGTVRQFSVARLLHGDVDPDLVRGQVVVLGMTALATGDNFAVPFDRIVPGVEVLATAIGNLVTGDGLRRTSLVRKVDAATAVMLPVLLVFLLAARRIGVGIALAAAAFVIWLGAVHAAFVAGYWLNMAVPLAAMAPAVVAYSTARLVADRTRAQRLSREKSALAKFQSPLLVQHILSDPDFLARPVAQDAAIVFLDLSAFTTVSEAVGPQRVRDLLADFQARVERDVVAHRGYVASFMGDGAMIVFGLPAARSDDPSRALLTIESLRDSITTWIAALESPARERLSVRIGGHFGVVVLSRLGAAEHQHLAATGDTVNATSRLLEIAKQLRANVIVTDELWSAADEATRAAMSAGAPITVDVRGRTQGLRVRVLAARKGPTSADGVK